MFEARKLYLQRSEISPLWETNISTRFFFFFSSISASLTYSIPRQKAQKTEK